MPEQSRVIAVIPAYNEEESLPRTLNELTSVRPDIDVVVVDDGSTDKTAEIAKSMGYTVISLPVNLGIGGAVQTGLRYALENGYEAAFQYDADGQHRPDQIQNIVGPILQGKADLVLGSRFIQGHGLQGHPGARLCDVAAAHTQLVGYRTTGYRQYLGLPSLQQRRSRLYDPQLLL